MRVKELGSFIAQQYKARDIHESTISDARARIEELKDEDIKLKKLRELVAAATEETQDKVKFHLSNLVTTGLNTVFPEKGYKFHLDFVQRRNQSECDLLIENKEGVRSKPMYRNGGGVNDILSLTLRIGRWSMSKASPIMILDEPSKFVDKEKQPMVVQLLQTLTEELGIQFIIVTHIPELAAGADNVIEIKDGSLKGATHEKENKKKKRKRKRKSN